MPILHRAGHHGLHGESHPQLVVAKAWQWLEMNGWYLVGALACWYLVLRPNLVDPALRAAAAPSAEKVRMLEEARREAAAGGGRAPSV